MRIKHQHAKLLRELASEVNLVGNFSQDSALKVLERENRFMSALDMAPFTQGASKEGLNLHSQTVPAVSEEYCRRRAQFNTRKLRWRVSRGARRSLGGIPFKASAIRDQGGPLRYGKMKLGVWDRYGLSGFHLGTGSLSEEARGRGFAHITVKIPELCGPRRHSKLEARSSKLEARGRFHARLGRRTQGPAELRNLDRNFWRCS